MTHHDMMIYYLAAVPWFFVGVLFALFLSAIKAVP